jgi:hypothetical protein
MSKLTRGRAHGEDGFALELALIFLTAVAVIVAALLGYAGSSSQATVVFRTSRGSEYDADAVMQADLSIVRATAGQGVFGNACAAYDPSTASPVLVLNTINPLRVDCTPISIATPTPRREVVLSVCPRAIAAPCPDASALLRADVIFYDDVTFGRALAIQSWSNQ